MTLARTLVIAAFVAALGAALLHASALAARSATHRAAERAARAAFDAGAIAARDAIAAAIAGGADPRTLSIAPGSVAAPCVADRAGTCLLTARATVRQSGGRGAAQGVQENDEVWEGRVAVEIAATVRGAGGAVFATRTRRAVFRTLRVPPFAALVGTRDLAAADAAAADGEDAGRPASTRVEVRYVNAATGAASAGDVWRTQPWPESGAGATGWDP